MRKCDCEARDAERCARARGEHEECCCECHGATAPRRAPVEPVPMADPFADLDPMGFVP